MAAGHDARTRKVVVALLAGTLGIPGLYWFWSQGRYGAWPADAAWGAGGIGTIWIAIWVASAVAALGRKDDRWNGRLYLIVGLSLAGLGAAFFWVRAQHDPLAGVLGPACRGEPVAAAAPATGAPLKILVLSDSGEGIRWTRTDAEWRAARAQDAALVACVAEEKVLVETCRYTGGSTVRRYAKVDTIKVVAARTGTRIGTFELRDEPGTCPPTKGSIGTYPDLVGSVPFASLASRLATYAAGAG